MAAVLAGGEDEKLFAEETPEGTDDAEVGAGPSGRRPSLCLVGCCWSDPALCQSRPSGGVPSGRAGEEGPQKPQQPWLIGAACHHATQAGGAAASAGPQQAWRTRSATDLPSCRVVPQVQEAGPHDVHDIETGTSRKTDGSPGEAPPAAGSVLPRPGGGAGPCAAAAGAAQPGATTSFAGITSAVSPPLAAARAPPAAPHAADPAAAPATGTTEDEFYDAAERMSQGSFLSAQSQLLPPSSAASVDGEGPDARAV